MRSEDTPPSVRVRPREPSPVHIEVPSPAKRRIQTRHVEPSSASVDWTASPIPHRLLIPEEVPVEPVRFSVDVGQSSFGIFGEGSSVADQSLPAEDSPSMLPSESTGMEESSFLGIFEVPTYTLTSLELTAMHGSYHSADPQIQEEVSSSDPGGLEYQSEIHHRQPSTVDPRRTDTQDHTLSFLQTLISELDPRAPESLDRFTTEANTTLDFLALLGLKEEELRYWEAHCREAEFLVRRLKSLSIVRHKVSLTDLRERVRLRRATADAAHDEFERSADAMRAHHGGADNLAIGIGNLTTKIRKLWTDLKRMISCKSYLQAEQDSKNRALVREQRRYQIRHRAMMDAGAALARASEELHNAETEYNTLIEIMSQLHDLQTRLL